MSIGSTMEVRNILQRDGIAVEIAAKFDAYKNECALAHERWREVRNYVFATDTTTTSNANLPWKNKTTIPKLTQIHDNLHANYMATIYPDNGEWFEWDADDEITKEKRESIVAYMKSKLRQNGFRELLSRLLYDYIQNGNVFATTDYVHDVAVNPEDGTEYTIYIGPKAVRISPYDIAFNLNAIEFKDSPKIIRTLMSLGDFKNYIEKHPNAGFDKKSLKKIIGTRKHISSPMYAEIDFNKSEGFQIDGFGSLRSYFDSGVVELIEFSGDYYDKLSGELKTNRLITIADRSTVLRDVPHPSWLGARDSINHCGWRERPDNLMAMGPLENLVGMQYRIDHLENIKADFFDLIAHPPLKIVGNVEEFKWAPFEQIYVGEGGDVVPIQIDATALSADVQIERLEMQMEKMAGAPEQAMGIRTPGEKTRYEVQVLENAATRIFQEKISKFECEIVEPLLNQMLEHARRNIDGIDKIKVLDPEFGFETFMEITADDLKASGKLRPLGAKHFAMKAEAIQNLTQFLGLVQQDPAVMSHISGKKLAEIVENIFGMKKYDLVKDNIRLYEQAETERLMRSLQSGITMEDQIPLQEVPRGVDPNAIV